MKSSFPESSRRALQVTLNRRIQGRPRFRGASKTRHVMSRRVSRSTELTWRLANTLSVDVGDNPSPAGPPEAMIRQHPPARPARAASQSPRSAHGVLRRHVTRLVLVGYVVLVGVVMPPADCAPAGGLDQLVLLPFLLRPPADGAARPSDSLRLPSFSSSSPAPSLRGTSSRRPRPVADLSPSLFASGGRGRSPSGLALPKSTSRSRTLCVLSLRGTPRSPSGQLAAGVRVLRTRPSRSGVVRHGLRPCDPHDVSSVSLYPRVRRSRHESPSRPPAPPGPPRRGGGRVRSTS